MASKWNNWRNQWTRNEFFTIRSLAFPHHYQHKVLETKYDRSSLAQQRSRIRNGVTSKTGTSMVDAGVEIDATGIMHNRIRMVCKFSHQTFIDRLAMGRSYFAKSYSITDSHPAMATKQWCAGCGFVMQLHISVFNPTGGNRKNLILIWFISASGSAITKPGYLNPIVDHDCTEESLMFLKQPSWSTMKYLEFTHLLPLTLNWGMELFLFTN